MKYNYYISNIKIDYYYIFIELLIMDISKYSNVSDIIDQIKNDNDYVIDNLIVELKINSIGTYSHCYYTLIDKNDRKKTIPLKFWSYKVMFPELGSQINNGDIIVISGRLDYYNSKSEISIKVNDLHKFGTEKGDYIKNKEQNEKKAIKLGYFDKQKKKYRFLYY